MALSTKALLTFQLVAQPLCTSIANYDLSTNFQLNEILTYCIRARSCGRHLFSMQTAEYLESFPVV